ATQWDRTATPQDQVGGDDEPDEERERTRPRPPREAVVPRRLHGEQRGLRQTAEADTPRGGTSRTARPTHVAEVADRRLPVEQQRRPEEQLSQRAPSPAAPLPRPRRADVLRARPP